MKKIFYIAWSIYIFKGIISLFLQQVQENVLRLVRKADQLLRRTNLDAEGVRQRLQTVDHECENFMVRLDNKRKNISMALSFFDLVEKALTTLDQIEVQLNTMDLPRNSAELADRHAQLSNVIVEASTPALHEGRILLERVSRDDPGADGVRRKVSIIFIINYSDLLNTRHLADLTLW